MKKLLMAGILGILAGGAIFYWRKTAEHSPMQEASAPPQKPGDEAKVQFPVPSAKDVEDAKEESDSPAQAPGKKLSFEGKSFEDVLVEAMGKDRLEALFDIQDLARRFVFTVENATNSAEPAPERSIVKPLDSEFLTEGKGQQLKISTANYARYKTFAEFVKDSDPRALVSVYVHFYSELQSAYDELGTGRYFNDRLIEVIDHILKTPDVEGQPRLIRPGAHYRYKYADVELENLSSSQKALLRMGSDNAAVVKEKLRRIRKLLAHRHKKEKSGQT